MKILLNNKDLNEALKDVSSLGFVPTMGSLHKGHVSLIKRCKNNCSKTIVSVFVNPTQFNNKKDFAQYPRNHIRDLSKLKKLNVDFVYIPERKHIYNTKRIKKIRLKKKDRILCAKFRKGHFEGVLDVMDRLISLIKPKFIFMGEKDFQQLHLVKNFIQRKFMSKVISCKTIRASNKLALSSRNFLLNKKQKLIAAMLTQSLINLKRKLKKNIKSNKTLIDEKIVLSKKFNVKIEYLDLRNIYNLKNSLKIKNSRLFIAYYIDKVRLIDNI